MVKVHPPGVEYQPIRLLDHTRLVGRGLKVNWRQLRISRHVRPDRQTRKDHNGVQQGTPAFASSLLRKNVLFSPSHTTHRKHSLGCSDNILIYQ